MHVKSQFCKSSVLIYELIFIRNSPLQTYLLKLQTMKELNINRKLYTQLKNSIPPDEIEEEIFPKYPIDEKTKLAKSFPSNQWNHMGDKRNKEDVKYPGKTPICYLENLLFYHTKPNDIVMDVFAGSGTMVDACNNMNRICIDTDLKPDPTRKKGEIERWNVSDGLPPQVEGYDKIKLIFLDPPYGKSEEYS